MRLLIQDCLENSIKMKKIFLLVIITLFTTSCATTKYQRELRRMDRKCDCNKQKH